MSLPCSLDDDGVTFRSSYDGSWHRLTPEGAVAAQEVLGADIQMVLDVCTELPADRDVVTEAGERTLAWAERARAVHSRPGQLLFGIVQGGVELDLRAEYAERLAGIGFDGYAVGGLSVGEPPDQMLDALAASLSHLPADRPRYLMGVGDPGSLSERGSRSGSTCSTACYRHASAGTVLRSPVPDASPLRRPGSPRTTRHSIRVAVARSADATAGLIFATCSTWANQVPAVS